MKTIIANIDKSQSLMIMFTKYEPLRNPAIIFCMFISSVQAWVSVIYKLRQWTDIRIKAWSMKRDYRQSFGVLIRHCPVLYTPEFPIREHLHVTLEF